MQAIEYSQFIDSKRLVDIDSGFDIDESFLNPKLFPFQKAIVRWALGKGRAARSAAAKGQRPWKTGSRFSPKAARPSR